MLSYRLFKTSFLLNLVKKNLNVYSVWDAPEKYNFETDDNLARRIKQSKAPQKFHSHTRVRMADLINDWTCKQIHVFPRAYASTATQPNSKHWFTTSFLEEGAGKRCSECTTQRLRQKLLSADWLVSSAALQHRRYDWLVDRRWPPDSCTAETLLAVGASAVGPQCTQVLLSRVGFVYLMSAWLQIGNGLFFFL